MNKVFKVAHWEFLCRVRSKSFIISTILLPLIMIAFVTLPSLLMTKASQGQKVIAIIDKTDSNIGYQLKNHLKEKYKLKNGNTEYNALLFENGAINDLKSKARALLDSSVISAYIVLPHNLMQNNEAGYYTKNLGDFRGKQILSSAITKVVSRARMIAANLDPNRINKITREVTLQPYELKKGEEVAGSEMMAYMTPIIFCMMLFFAVFRSSQVLFRSVLEERSNKLIEILLSSLSPTQLMAGKILGLGLVGLVQLAFYLAIGMLVSTSQGMNFISTSYIFLFLLYFLTGYLLYASIFAAIGCIFNSEQEAQQYVAVLSLFTVLPIILSSYVITNPTAPFVSVMSYIPLITPFFMIMRIGIEMPSTFEIVSTLLVMVGFVALMMYAAGKIFKVAILMYGKRPKFDEILRWIKA